MPRRGSGPDGLGKTILLYLEAQNHLSFGASVEITNGAFSGW